MYVCMYVYICIHMYTYVDYVNICLSTYLLAFAHIPTQSVTGGSAFGHQLKAQP